MNWQEVVLLLKDRGIVKLEVKYDGSGDSGSIEDCLYYDAEDNEYYRSQIDITDNQHDDIINLVYPMLDDIEDWYNNDGGYGTVTINLNDFTYSIENNVRYMEVDTFEHQGELKDFIKD
jgi:hypothetical protein